MFNIGPYWKGVIVAVGNALAIANEIFADDVFDVSTEAQAAVTAAILVLTALGVYGKANEPLPT